MEFEQLLEYQIEDIFQQIKSDLSKGVEEANSYLDKKYNDILSQYSDKIKEQISKREEEIGGEKAKIEVENKRTLLNEQDFWIKKVYGEVLKRARDITSSSEYTEGIRKIISDKAKDSSIIYCNSGDQDLIRSLVKSAKIKANIQIDNSVIGGIKITYPDQGLTMDYSLNLILDQVFESVKPKIVSILFGED
ncbi:V-type ATP synthase subunit E [Candidatus Acidianus copahuensis]|uniref:ATP synthase subunit E n=1 Tax=Candidatus Acidianus copahuensis TaxID=1160895 RepID=A0A031LPI8_9CREN|nr:V-type ATP synthase subunit E [Candidatus Acidianus copahuensis]EZQ06997.1 ATP synthase subunit E [Candidatus Acidianus copahuensis]NON61868.1 hypothetical protein [Acidianus sp. RZ1]